MPYPKKIIYEPFTELGKTELKTVVRGGFKPPKVIETAVVGKANKKLFVS